MRWLIAQHSELLDATIAPLFPHAFAIFGHGNVLGLGTALHDARAQLTTWRGMSEQGMALAAVGLARATDRRQVGIATSSIGPGALNMVTAAGVAHANRLPLLLLPGDTFTGRGPDPVLQQVEHFGDPGITANDAFRAVTRYFDRITRPEQLLATLPQVTRVLLDPADTGPVVLALPQDVQVESYDFPTAMFTDRTHRVPRPRADQRALTDAATLIRTAQRPLFVAGGGVRYSGAAAALLDLAVAHGIPIVDTAAGRTLIPHDHPCYAGPLGIIGSTAANTTAAQADVVIAVGTRLQDFMTSSWTDAPDVRIVTINTAAFDAVKHGALAITGDALATLTELDEQLSGWHADPSWLTTTARHKALWDKEIDGLRAPRPAGAPLTYAQVVGIVNDASGRDDYVLAASGGFPGEVHGGWRTADVAVASTTSGATMDLEYGFSCMGYEIAGPWGAAIARARSHPDGIVTALLGDGSYLMLNSELYAAVLARHPFVAVVCDNGGYAVIHRLQTGQGADGFNNLLDDCASTEPGGTDARVDFTAHARALGCHVETVPTDGTVTDLREAYARARKEAKAQQRPAVVVCHTDPTAWTESGAWWEVGVPATLAGRADFDGTKPAQLRWLQP